MFSQTRCCPFPQERVEPLHAEGLAATGQAHAFPVPLGTSSTIYLTGSRPSASELEELLDSPEQWQKTVDTIQNIVEADHLGTNGPDVKKRLHKHKIINTKEGHVIYSKSLADGNKAERLSSCKTVLESVKNGLDHTPLEEWTKQHLKKRTDGMYRAKDLARQLNVKRQNLPFVSSGTLLKLEKMPPDEQLILTDMLDASSII